MYVIIWEYVVRSDRAAEFVDAYGPRGPWAELFGRADGFLGLELLRREDRADCYLTIDRWRSLGHFEAFKARLEADYHRLDEAFSELTLEEERIGSFTLPSDQERGQT